MANVVLLRVFAAVVGLTHINIIIKGRYTYSNYQHSGRDESRFVGEDLQVRAIQAVADLLEGQGDTRVVCPSATSRHLNLSQS